MSRVLTGLGWALAAGAAAVGMVRADGSTALGAELYLGPAFAACSNLLFGVITLGFVAGLRRLGLPRAAKGLGLVAPWLVVAGVWLPALAAVPAREGTAPERRAVGVPIVLLLTLDTFRADHLNVQQDPSPKAKRRLTPKLDALAAAGAVLTQAVTSAPLTAPAHAGILTGLSPTEHGLVRNGQQMAEADVASVVQQIRAAGWRTGAFVSSNVLDRSVGLSSGFSHYDDRWGAMARLHWVPLVEALSGPLLHRVRRGNETVERALRWLAESPQPTLLWVHLYDPHSPYLPPPEWLPPAPELAEARAADDADAAARESSGGPKRAAHVGRALYRSEIRWTDHVAGTLIDAVGEHAIIFAVGDHGESLGEHRAFFTHGDQLYEPVLKVPFIVRWPGRVEPGTRMGGLVSTTEVARLLREATGITPYRGLQELASAPAYTSGQRAPPGRRARRAAPGTTERHVGACMRLPHAKILTNDGASYSMFDLVSDPDELDPLPVPIDHMVEEAELRRMVGVAVPEAADGERERLEALGYEE